MAGAEKKVIVACSPGSRAEVMAELDTHDVDIDIVGDTAELLERRPGPEPVPILLTVDFFRKIITGGRAQADRLRQVGPLVLLLRHEDFGGIEDMAELIDALVVIDEETVDVARLADIARFGYSALKPSIWQELIAQHERTQLLASLTGEELEILNGLRQALTNREITDRLGLPPATVKARVRAVLHKLRLRNRTEAAVFVARHEDQFERYRARAAQHEEAH